MVKDASISHNVININAMMTLFNIFEDDTRKILCIFPGGFHIFTHGHFSVYQFLKDQFPTADVFVASSNNTKERPFPFKEKRFLATQAGIPANRFVEVISPYKAEEITKNYDPANTVLIFALSEKDKDRLGKPTKKDGSLSYMQPFPGYTEKCATFNKHGYYIVTPTTKFSIMGQTINSASQIREMYKNADDAGKLAIIHELYPKSNKTNTIKDILDNVLHPTITEDHFDSQGFWVGEGGGASGVLPVCSKTKRICLAWRSDKVQHGDCWGTFGGAIQRGMTPDRSAKEELAEETGYRGPIVLHNAFVFSKGTFTYKNFIGVVPNEFNFNPEEGHGWETTNIAWVSFSELMDDMKQNADLYHFGLVSLIKHSYKTIASLLKDKITEAKKKISTLGPKEPIHHSGWLAPNGRFIVNPSLGGGFSGGHWDTVKVMGFTTYEQMFMAGYIRTRVGHGWATFEAEKPLSEVEPLILNAIHRLPKESQVEVRVWAGRASGGRSLYMWNGKEFREQPKKMNREVYEGRKFLGRLDATEDGWFTPEHEFYPNGERSHIETARLHGMRNMYRAYEAGWIHFYSSVGSIGIMTTNKPYRDVESYVDDIAKRIEHFFPIITLECKDGLYEWDGKQFSMKKPFRVSEAVEKANRIKQNGWITDKNKFLENPVGTLHFTVLPRYGMQTYEEAYDAGWIRFSVDYKNRAFFETTLPYDTVEKRLIKLAKQTQSVFPEIFAYTGRSAFGNSTDKYEWDGKQFKQLYGSKVYEDKGIKNQINKDGWVTNTGEFIANDLRSHLQTLRANHILSYEEAYKKDWLRISVGKTGRIIYIETMHPINSIYDRLVHVTKRMKKWPEIVAVCGSGTDQFGYYQWTGKDFNKIDQVKLWHLVYESPDFGYTHFNDRDNDLSKLKWDVVDDKANGVIAIRAFSDNPSSKNEPRLQFMTQRYGEFDGLIIGHCWGYDGTTVHIDQSRVTDDWKGTGLGQMMYDKLIDLAKKKGFKKVDSDTSMSADARRAWRRLSQRYPVQTKEIPWRPTESYYFIDLQGAK